MQLKLVSTAVLAALAGSASAAPLSLLTSTPDVVIRIAGASAQDPLVMKYIDQNICGGTGAGMTYDVSSPVWSGTAGSTLYTTGGNAKDHYAIYCTASGAGAADVLAASDGTPLTGKKVLVIKRSKSGSFMGVNPVLDGTVPSGDGQTGMMTANAANCATAPVGNKANCTLTLDATAVPNAGLADLEGDVFATDASNVAFGGFVAPSAGPNYSSLGLQGFGIAASPELYAALVTKQYGAGCFSAGLPIISAACQPSLTKAEVAAVFTKTGKVNVDWTPIAGVTGPTGSDGKVVYACRRVSTSGTEMAFRTYFLEGGATGDHGGAQLIGKAADSGIGTNAKRLWVENSGTGDMQKCLAHTAGTPAGVFALGYMSLENKAGAAGTWQFVKINGVSPTFTAAGAADATQKQNLIQGTYDWGYESVGYVNPTDTSDYADSLLSALAVDMADTSAASIDAVGVAIVPTGGTRVNASSPARIAKGSRFGNSYAPLQLVK